MGTGTILKQLVDSISLRLYTNSSLNQLRKEVITAPRPEVSPPPPPPPPPASQTTLQVLACLATTWRSKCGNWTISWCSVWPNHLTVPENHSLSEGMIVREPEGPTVHPPPPSPHLKPSTMILKCTLGCPEHNLTCSPDSHWDALEL